MPHISISILALTSHILTSTDRLAAAQAFARALGAEACIVFVRDTAVDQLLPAVGFPQTLPHGSAWRAFLAATVRDGQASGRLSYPTADGEQVAFGLASDENTACVLLSATEFTPPETILAEARLTLPMLGAALAGERAVAMAKKQSSLAQRLADESQALTNVLDAARRSLQSALTDAELKRAQVMAQSAELDAIFRAAPDPLVVYSASGHVVRSNASAEALYAQLTGGHGDAQTPCDLVSALSAATHDADDVPAARGSTQGSEILARALAGEFAIDHYVTSAPDSTSKRLFIGHAAPISAPDRSFAGAVFVATDVTSVYELERQKVEFLAVVSHELRTPLTSLKLTHGVLTRQLGDADPRQQTSMRRMQTAIHRLERLVGDLLESSRLRANSLEMRMAPCRMVEVCRRVIDEHQPSASQRITFEVQDADEEVMVDGDADRLTQALSNLVGNAIKFSPVDETIIVRLSCDAQHLHVAVQDYGPGIPETVQQRIFDQFYRAPHAQITRGSEIGLGLGLFIARAIIERHGGAIGVESVPGAGSTFWFTLAMSSPQQQATRPEPRNA